MRRARAQDVNRLQVALKLGQHRWAHGLAEVSLEKRGGLETNNKREGDGDTAELLEGEPIFGIWHSVSRHGPSVDQQGRESLRERSGTLHKTGVNRREIILRYTHWKKRMPRRRAQHRDGRVGDKSGQRQTHGQARCGVRVPQGFHRAYQGRNVRMTCNIVDDRVRYA